MLRPLVFWVEAPRFSVVLQYAQLCGALALAVATAFRHAHPERERAKQCACSITYDNCYRQLSWFELRTRSKLRVLTLPRDGNHLRPSRSDCTLPAHAPDSTHAGPETLFHPMGCGQLCWMGL